MNCVIVLLVCVNVKMEILQNNLFFTSDSHFLHKYVCEYQNRNYVSVDEMNKQLILNWNSVVPSNGVVYHLGDFSLGNPKLTLDIINRLNGGIILVKGNHEKTIMGSKYLRDKFTMIHEYGYEIKVEDEDATYTSAHGKQLIVLSHFPYEVWHNSHYGSWHLHGHSHNKTYSRNDQLRLDVGVDNPFCNFKPVSYLQVKEFMKTKNFKPSSNH